MMLFSCRKSTLQMMNDDYRCHNPQIMITLLSSMLRKEKEESILRRITQWLEIKSIPERTERLEQ
jgi:hypothetical protein